MTPEQVARFDAKWTWDDAECWVWQAALDPYGYGRFRLDGGMRLAHRVAYEHARGAVPRGLDLDHLCRNRACVNPEHLEPVTRSTNLARSPLMGARASALTHCKRGHDLVGGDVRVTRRGTRVCRPCERLTRQQRRARQKEAA